MVDLDAVTRGNRLELARLLTEVENQTPAGEQALDRLFARAGKAHLVGITGAPGTGKSSLVSCLAKNIRVAQKQTVAIVAVDPSSPFSGGAILGDRVRMRELAGDPGVFIRSMASRGELGGLASATAGVVQVLDAAGFDFILIETVGAGQSEVDIACLAYTTLVVESPGLGDDIQAIKAGILEIADILVVNKSDLPGAENTARALRANLDLGYHLHMNHNGAHRMTIKENEVRNTPAWTPPIIQTIATQHNGIDEVVAEILKHREYLIDTGLWQKREQDRLRSEVYHLLQTGLVKRWQQSTPPQVFERLLQKVFARELSPRAAIDSLLNGSYN